EAGGASEGCLGRRARRPPSGFAPTADSPPWSERLLSIGLPGVRNLLLFGLLGLLVFRRLGRAHPPDLPQIVPDLLVADDDRAARGVEGQVDVLRLRLFDRL